MRKRLLLIVCTTALTLTTLTACNTSKRAMEATTEILKDSAKEASSEAAHISSDSEDDTTDNLKIDDARYLGITSDEHDIFQINITIKDELKADGIKLFNTIYSENGEKMTGTNYDIYFKDCKEIKKEEEMKEPSVDKMKDSIVYYDKKKNKMTIFYFQKSKVKQVDSNDFTVSLFKNKESKKPNTTPLFGGYSNRIEINK